MAFRPGEARELNRAAGAGALTTPPPRPAGVAANGWPRTPGGRQLELFPTEESAGRLNNSTLVVRSQMPDELPGEIQAPAHGYRTRSSVPGGTEQRQGTISRFRHYQSCIPLSTRTQKTSRYQATKHQLIGNDPLRH
ncbi:MAG: hypothetical protein U1D30_05465 [Planctomycetota bacterium]